MVIVTATHVGLGDHRPLLTGVISPVRSRPGGWGGEGSTLPNLPWTQSPERPQCPAPTAVPQLSHAVNATASFTLSSQSRRDTHDIPGRETEAQDREPAAGAASLVEGR